MHTLLKTARPGTPNSSTRLTQVPADALTRPLKPETFHQPRVMDLGHGTGLWMLQMAERFPDTEFHGFDINYMLPQTIMQNIVPYIPYDIERPWNNGWGTWNMIHVQLMLGSITNWNYLFEQARRHLAPGGWFESVEIDWEPRCENNTMNLDPHQPGLKQWWDRVSRAYRIANHPLEYHRDIVHELQAHGFKEIKHIERMVPVNGWHPTDQNLHRVGSWWNIAMSPGNADEGCHGLEAMSLRPLMEIESRGEHKWTHADVQRLCQEALHEASNLNVHAYNVQHIVTARAPRADGT
jgi:SAM-dependent methyltransferase